MAYRVLRAVFSWLLRAWYRVAEVRGDRALLGAEGPVIYVANHPNGLIDPGLLFVLIERQVTFLAKAPLFAMPVLGGLLRALGCLPVYRKQDGAQTAQNEGTLTASIEALVAGKAITLFPEGKSHSEPQLQELKTGCARIALQAVARGADVAVVPVGLTYAEKERFGSAVHVELGERIAARAFAPGPGEDAFARAQALTEAIATGLEKVTLNLGAWEELPLLETAEALYALEKGDAVSDAARRRAFAQGLKLVREEQPERFTALKLRLLVLRRRLALVQAAPEDLTLRYRPWAVLRFALVNWLWLSFGLPLFLLGAALFVVPYWVPHFASRGAKAELDVQATVKVLTTLVVAPLWWALLTTLAFALLGAGWGFATLVLVPPLAFFTRYFLERRIAKLGDARTFLTFFGRGRLKARLSRDAKALAQDIERLAQELRPRVAG